MKSIRIIGSILISLILSCNNSEKKPFLRGNSVITYEVFRINDSAYGYRIYVDGFIFIEQKIIPGVNGVFYFESFHKAQKTAEFVAKKYQYSVEMPFVTYEELDSLGVLSPKVKNAQKF